MDAERQADHYLGSFEIDADCRDEWDSRYLVHNRTPHEMRLRRQGATSELRLAPLGERVIRGARLKSYERDLIPLREAHLLRIRLHHESPATLFPPELLIGAGQIGFLTAAALIFFTQLKVSDDIAVTALVASGMSLAVGLIRSLWREYTRARTERAVDREEGDIIFRGGGEFVTGDEIHRALHHVTVLVFVFVLGGLAPAAAVYYGTDLNRLLAFDDGVLRVVDNERGRLISRLIQICYLAILSLFPALLYFQYDRQRVGTLRGRWVRAIFRLHPGIGTLADVHARYGDELAEASFHSDDSSRLLGGHRSPIIVATILITLGWSVLVLRTESFDFQAQNNAALLAETAVERAEQAQEQAAIAADPDVDSAARAAAVASAAEAQSGAEEAAEILDQLVEAELEDVGATTTTTPSDSDGATSSTTATTATQTTAPGQNGPTTTLTADQQAAEDEAAAAASAAAASSVAEGAEQSVNQLAATPFFQLLSPRPSAAAMAFLGAYFYAVYLVLHGYYRNDLRPKVYNQITARLVVVVVVAYLISVTLGSEFPSSWIWMLAFLAGIMPRPVVLLLTDVVSSRGRNVLATERTEAFSTPLPLTDVQGVHLWERDRLMTEGVTDLEALAHADLVETMIRARVPIERLIDWVDQALLILHLHRNEAGKTAIDGLRQLGLRTATDVVDAAEGTEETVGKLRQALGQPIEVLVAGLKKEPNFGTVRHWLAAEHSENGNSRGCFYDLDGRLWPKPADEVCPQPGEVPADS